MEYSDIANVVMPGDATVTGCGVSFTNNRRDMEPPLSRSRTLRSDSLDTYKTPPPSKKESWSQIVKSGRVKMTEYEHKKTSTSYSLAYVRYPLAKSAGFFVDYDHQTGLWSCLQTVDNVGSYEFVTDYDSLTPLVPHLPYTVSEDNREVVMRNVVDDAALTLDLLTEFGERAETFEIILGALKAIRRPLQSYKDAKDYILKTKKDPRKIAEALANLWLKYRYGIMPIVYTIQDAIEVLNAQERLYDRSGSSMTSSANFPTPEDNCLVDSGSFSRKHSAVTKSRFSTSAIGSADLLGFNPLRTGWELIPFSFVVDWFLNVGSWLNSKTFSLFDMSSERKFCVSTKTEATIITNYHWKTPDIPEVTRTAHDGTTQVHPVVPGFSGVSEVRRMELEHYRRDLFSPSDISFSLDPYLNWERLLDGYALSIKPIMKALGGLR